MKLKYYLRGLGIGIFVTALIMGISLGGRKEMSDEEVIARAKELGMTESGAEESRVLAELENTTEEPEEKLPEEPEQAESMQTESVQTESVQQESGEVDTMSEEESSLSQEETAETEKSGQQETDAGNESGQDGEIIAGQMVSITVVSGDDSSAVCRKLEEAGLVVSASAYDRYLCDNGYAKKLAPGTYEIAIGSSEETIAKVITKSR